MKVSIPNRLRLLAILPEQGNLLTLKIVRQLREELSFSEEEHKEFEIKTEGNSIRWKLDAEEKEIEFGEQAKELIDKRLRELNEKDELTLPDLELWEAFIGSI